MRRPSPVNSGIPRLRHQPDAVIAGGQVGSGGDVQPRDDEEGSRGRQTILSASLISPNSRFGPIGLFTVQDLCGYGYGGEEYEARRAVGARLIASVWAGDYDYRVGTDPADRVTRRFRPGAFADLARAIG